MARILVLDGHSAAALAITRSAGQAGHWVAVGGNRGLFAAAKLSRYCRAAVDYPVSTSEPEAFVQSILDTVRSHAIDLVLPITDWTLGPLSTQRERFAGLCVLAIPSPEVLELASDKYRTIQFAESLGIAIPRTLLVSSTDDLPQWQSTAPVVIKDRFSVRWTRAKAVFGSVAYAHSFAELQNKVSARVRAAGDVMIQEFVSGVGIGVSCFIVAGTAFLPFQWQRVREVDPRGSGSSARKSVLLDESLLSQSRELVTKMCFEGIAMVEYKKTADGRFVLMEVNGRPWGSIGLPIACGIDYPKWWIEWWLKGSLPPPNVAYRKNVMCRRVVGELTHLTNLRRGRPLNWPGPYPGFWPTVFAMALPWRPGMCYDDLWLSDLRPGLAGIRNWFQSRWEGKGG